MKLLNILIIAIIFLACKPEPQLAQITAEDVDKAFVDYTTMIDLPIPDKVYSIFVNEQKDWWVEHNDSLYYASEWIAVVPAENPYTDVLYNNPNFRFVTTIVIDGHSLVDIKLFIEFYEKNRKYISPVPIP